jgi:regulator of protease activity HflC (stomatin/prohibitin superfamily)
VVKVVRKEDAEEPRKTYSVREWFTLILLIAAFAYLVSPWDILSFSFFDDLAFVVVAFSLWIVVARQTPKKLRRSMMSIGWIIVIVFSAIFGASLASASWKSVEVGHALLIIDLRSGNIYTVTGPSAGFLVDGSVAILGLIRTVDMYYATDVYEDTIPCFSSDQLEMNVTIQMRWALDPNLLIELYRNYPKLDYEATAIDSIMEETIRFVTRNYTAVQTIASRPVIAEQMQSAVQEKLLEEPTLSRALSYIRFDLKNIAYPTGYTQAIEQKLEAEQKQLQAEFERERVLILANATAQQLVIEALGEAQAKIELAKGTQDAIQRLIQAAGTGANASRIAELYIYTEALKVMSQYVQSLILIQGATVPLISIPATNSTTP